MDLKPVLQVIDILAFQTQTPTEGGEENMRDRYRVLLSDGYFHRQGVLSANRSELVTSQQLQKGSIVKLTKFLCITIRERMYVFYLFSFPIFSSANCEEKFPFSFYCC